MKYSFTLAILFIFNVLAAQTADSTTTVVKKKRRSDPSVPESKMFAEGITAADLKVLVDSLAGPVFAGRETGTLGQKLAGEYIAAEFKAAGLQAGGDNKKFFQNIALSNQTWDDLALLIEDKEFQNRADYYVFSEECPAVGTLDLKDFIFVGYGIDDPKYSDYGKADVEGKVVVFFTGEPLGKDAQSIVSENGMPTAWSLDWKKKVKVAQAKGAVAAFIVDKNLKETVSKNRRLLYGRGGWQPISPGEKKPASDLKIPHLFISEEVLAALMGKKFEKADDKLAEAFVKKTFKPQKFKAKTQLRMHKSGALLEGTNVIGWIEGSDPDRKKDVVIVTAHYDHLGEHDGSVFYGADDNASGTAAVIEIAKAFAEAKKKGVEPRRSVVFMLVSGEEKGLLGSKFYTEFPTFPLNKTIANINIDMVGRVDAKHANNPNYIYVIGDKRTSEDLHNILKEMNDWYTKIELDYSFNDPNEPNRYFSRSDHYNFVKKGVPATFFFNGTHDDYHRATDTKEKINFPAAEIRTRLAFHMVWEIANRQGKVSADFDPSKI